MALQYLDPQVIGNLLSCTWQQDLGTSEDPANGQWYTDGANGDAIGLYGGLTDALPGQVQLDASAAVVTTTRFVADSGIVIGGSPSPAAQLSYGYVTSIASTQSSVASVAQGTAFSIPVNEVLTQGPASVAVRFLFSSAPGNAAPTLQPQQFSRAVPVSVPPGHIYQVVLSAETQHVTVPWTVRITVTGTTETWFANRVNGHYNWSADAGTAFGRISQYQCAGAESGAYANAGNGAGTVTVTGTLDVSQVGGFTALVYDVTAQVMSGGLPPPLAPGSAFPSAPVVETIPL